MRLAPAPVSQARWKQFYLPLLSSQKLGGGKVSKEGRFITWEGGRERDSLCRNTSATANLSNVVQILQNIHTTGIWQLQTLPNSHSGNRVARKADTNYLKLGLAYFPCDSTSEALHY